MGTKRRWARCLLMLNKFNTDFSWRMKWRWTWCWKKKWERSRAPKKKKWERSRVPNTDHRHESSPWLTSAKPPDAGRFKKTRESGFFNDSGAFVVNRPHDRVRQDPIPPAPENLDKAAKRAVRKARTREREAASAQVLAADDPGNLAAAEAARRAQELAERARQRANDMAMRL